MAEQSMSYCIYRKCSTVCLEVGDDSYSKWLADAGADLRGYTLWPNTTSNHTFTSIYWGVSSHKSRRNIRTDHKSHTFTGFLVDKCGAHQLCNTSPVHGSIFQVRISNVLIKSSISSHSAWENNSDCLEFRYFFPNHEHWLTADSLHSLLTECCPSYCHLPLFPLTRRKTRNPENLRKSWMTALSPERDNTIPIRWRCLKGRLARFLSLTEISNPIGMRVAEKKEKIKWEN